MALTLPQRRVAVLALPVALAAAGAAAFAQSTTEASMMTTLICRPALSGETANAKMVAGSTTLVCKPFAVSMHMSDGSLKTIGSATAKPAAGPDFSNALTAQQATAAYNLWVQQTFHIDPATQHSP